MCRRHARFPASRQGSLDYRVSNERIVRRTIAHGRYEWLGKKHKVTSSASRFSRYAEHAGTFSVKSVALRDNQVSFAGSSGRGSAKHQCKRQISEMDRVVHALPSVKIQEGVQSLREGE